MKCLKVDEYIKRTATVEETRLLLQELEVSRVSVSVARITFIIFVNLTTLE